jgi:hypothetical protein
MPDGEARDRSETLIGDPGVLAKEVGFGEDGAQDPAFRIIALSILRTVLTEE